MFSRPLKVHRRRNALNLNLWHAIMSFEKTSHWACAKPFNNNMIDRMRRTTGKCYITNVNILSCKVSDRPNLLKHAIEFRVTPRLKYFRNAHTRGIQPIFPMQNLNLFFHTEFTDSFGFCRSFFVCRNLTANWAMKCLYPADFKSLSERWTLIK